MINELFYAYLEDIVRLDKLIEKKSDKDLVEDLYFRMSTIELPRNCEMIMVNYLETKRLSPKSRKKLEDLYRLMYSKKIIEE